MTEWWHLFPFVVKGQCMTGQTVFSTSWSPLQFILVTCISDSQTLWSSQLASLSTASWPKPTHPSLVLLLLHPWNHPSVLEMPQDPVTWLELLPLPGRQEFPHFSLWQSTFTHEGCIWNWSSVLPWLGLKKQDVTWLGVLWLSHPQKPQVITSLVCLIWFPPAPWKLKKSSLKASNLEVTLDNQGFNRVPIGALN